MTNHTTGFSSLGISPRILQELNQRGFANPTVIQQKAIPIALQGKDVIGIAQTGTGKTFAFSIPLLQKWEKEKGSSLILLPTRELAHQVEMEILKLGKGLGVKTALLIGGASMFAQIQKLRARPDVIIATPGRLNDHLTQRTANLTQVKTIVLDEADRMLDMGFEPQIRTILKMVPKPRQTLLFSATMPQEIVKMVHAYMVNPVRIEASPVGTTTDTITQEAYLISKEKRMALLHSILSKNVGPILVFIKTKHAAKKLAIRMKGLGHTISELHSDRSTGQRRDALQGFKMGKYKVLIATDIASRGIDVSGIQLVINYDLPQQNEDYVHRIGRTGRAGKKGTAITFVTPQEQKDFRYIQQKTKGKITMLPLPVLVELPPAPPAPVKPMGRPFHPGKSRFEGKGSRRPFHRWKKKKF